MLALLLTALLVSENPVKAPNDFWAHWGDGRGEISSFKLTIPRYGELRQGYAVLIFVTEDISRKTRIKVESDAIPKNERVPVLKLNRVFKFPTGIYDYSVMTSTFSSVEAELGRPPLHPLKISLTAQEWCGQVFHMLVPHEHELAINLHSYFEREGDQRRTIDLPENAIFEDNLPIWIRELRGEVMASGEYREVTIMPSLWDLRTKHEEARFRQGWIRKEDGGLIEVLGQKMPVWKWSWQIGDRTETYWVEKSGAQRIAKFSSSDGTEGTLQASLREAYWQLNGNVAKTYREKLKID